MAQQDGGNKAGKIIGGLIAVGVGLAVALVVGILIGNATEDTKTTTVGLDGKPVAKTTNLPAVAPAFTLAQLSALPTDNWLANGGSIANQRYSPLKQINEGNANQLKGVWMTHLNNSGTAAKYSAEATPLSYNGIIYVPTGADDVFAVNQGNGKILWQYKANLSPSLASVVCCGWLNRGVSLGEGQIYSGQLDGNVVALDQQTGKVNWKKPLADPKEGYTITMPPLYVNGMVIVGPVGAEYGVRGFMRALDAKTGKTLWTHYNIPGPGEPDGDSWPAGTDQYKHGGATVWSSPSVDPKLGLMYYATGNAGSDWDGRERTGDNKWTSSVLAIDIKTGKQAWGYQQVHHDIWDYDSPGPVVMIDAKVNGKDVQGVAHPSKTGYVYFLDRKTGKPIHEIKEMPVPQSKVIKNTSPTQPIPQVMKPFSPTKMTQKMIDSAQAAVNTATPKGTTPPKVKASPQFTPYEPVGAKTIIASTPGPAGGANWQPSSYNPETHMYYVCSQSNSAAVAIPKETTAYKTGESTTGIALAGIDGFNTPGFITAYNMDTGKTVWQKSFPDSCYSGLTTTGGNILFAGRNKGQFTAMNAMTGEVLWSFQTGAGANGVATVVQRNGKEYVIWLSGGNALAGTTHGDNLWMFGLDGTMGPVAEGGSADAIEHAGEGGGNDTGANAGDTQDESTPTTAGDATAGGAVWADNCAACHGEKGTGGNGGPDLTTIPAAKIPADVIKQVTNGGGGMPAFKGALTDQQIADVAAYVTKNITNK